MLPPTSKYSVWGNLPEVSSSPQPPPDFGHYKQDPSLCFPDTVKAQMDRNQGQVEGTQQWQ